MKSKLGLHINGLWGGVDDWLLRAKPQVLLSMDHNPDHWAQLRAQLPNTFIIGRHGDEETNADFYPTDDDTTDRARARAEGFFNAIREDVKKMSGCYDAWVGLNEPVCHTDKQAENLSAWHERWGDLMKSIGVKSVAYTFSQGVPEKNHWAILAKGLEHCDLLGLHEYWYPHFDSPKMDPWHVLRYHTAWEQLPDSAKRPIVITECGADGGAGDIDTKGWKKIVIHEGIYLEDLQAYDAALQKDPYVIGATIYCAGAGGDWESWDVSTAWTIPDWIGKGGDALPLRLENLTKPSKAAPTKPQPPARLEPARPETPAQAPLPLAKALWFVEEAMRQLEAKNADAAHKILSETVIDWFYDTARDNSTDLKNAQAHTTARWWSEEATRKIEDKKLNEAREILRDDVLTWLNTSGPSALGILGVEYPSKPKAKAKPKASAKKPTKKKATAKKSAVKKATAKKPAAKKSRSTKPKAMLLNAE